MTVRVLISATMVLFFLGLVTAGATYSLESSVGPLLIGTIGFALAVAQLASDIRTPDDRSAEKAREHRLVAVHLLWLSGLVALIVTFGQMLGGAAFLVSYVRFALDRHWHVAVVTALLTQVVLYALFELALGVDLFDGLLFS